MAFKQASIWACEKCDWKDDKVMQSDVLLPKPHEHCPRCGGDLVGKKASLLDEMQAKIKQVLA
ncbi:MAG: hypothetical protein Q4E16_06595 [Neisseria sp.]|nr:hypothetical protein [Neisseria sp.]